VLRVVTIYIRIRVKGTDIETYILSIISIQYIVEDLLSEREKGHQPRSPRLSRIKAARSTPHKTCGGCELFGGHQPQQLFDPPVQNHASLLFRCVLQHVSKKALLRKNSKWWWVHATLPPMENTRCCLLCVAKTSCRHQSVRCYYNKLEYSSSSLTIYYHTSCIHLPALKRLCASELKINSKLTAHSLWVN
jgi:hypothetical protein